MSEVPEVKTAKTSPVPPKAIPAPIQSQSSPSVTQDKLRTLMSFGMAINEVIQGKHVKREVWPDGFYLHLYNDELYLMKPDGTLWIMAVHKVDLLATDWSVV